MFQFLHAADLHLDSPLHGLEQYDGAPVEAIRQATRRALENLVQLAIEEQVAFVVIAGDIYDGDWKDYNTGLFFTTQMSRLAEAGIRVYLISGNHDAQSIISRSLPLPDNVHAFPTDRAETIIDEATGAAIHGQGFASRAVLKDLSADYPRPVGGRFNIGVLHTCATGIEGHDPYAPCTIEGLRDLGYDYWALGHIHIRQFLCERSPVIAFSGNIQGRHIRETGPKGCLLVTVEGGQPTCEFRPLDVFRWEHLEIDGSDHETPDDISSSIIERVRRELEDADGRHMALRITVCGSCPAHEELLSQRDHFEQEVRSRIIDEARQRVWIEKLRVATRPIREEEPTIGEGPLAELRNLVAHVDDDPELQKVLAEELSALRKLPREIRDELFDEIDEATGLDDPRWLVPIARQAGGELFGRLADE